MQKPVILAVDDYPLSLTMLEELLTQACSGLWPL